MPPYRVPMEVRFADLDALGHVNSSRILAYAEQARVQWLLETRTAPSATQLPIIVAAAHVDYKHPIQLQTTLDVYMWTSRIGNKSWDFEYEVRDRSNGVVCANIRTTQVAYDYAKGESRPIDAPLRARLEGLQKKLVAA
jgi:acyl-CoA thioester hydrolase